MSDDKEVLTGFDQTNGVIDGLEGESDGTAEGEELSAGERDVDGDGEPDDPTVVALDSDDNRVNDLAGAEVGENRERTGD